MKKIMLLVCILLCMGVCAYAAETTYSGVCDPIVIDQPGEHTVILNGVNIDAEDSSAIDVKSPATKLTIILKNGTENTLIVGDEYFYDDNYAGINNNGVSLVIRCESAGEDHECDENCGKLIVTGACYGAGIGSNSKTNFSGSITVDGGNISVESENASGIGGGFQSDFEGTITINGGNIETKGYIAGIGCSKKFKGVVIINGGNIATVGGLAGIGSAEEFGGTVCITNGIVNAKGPFLGSGIGAGDDGRGKFTGSVTISGGEVTAIGYATGIGGGMCDEFSGSVTISGGKVVASTTGWGAAIGAGTEGVFDGTITITGGEVTATAKYGAAGIGTGDLGEFNGSVIITGGTIEATGGVSYGGTGIGAGMGGNFNGSVIVKGGIVTATGSNENERAIGAGYGGTTSENAVIAVDPITGLIEVKEGIDKDSAAEIEGSPYKRKTDLMSLLVGKRYAQFRPVAHDECFGGTATCVNQAICEVCHDEYGKLNKENHTNTVILPAVAPTKTTPGLTEGLICNGCGTVIIPQETIPCIPQTGDGTNFVLLAALALVGMIGMTVIIRRKNEA